MNYQHAVLVSVL